jgi:drug/metabolite transporter (DMT)-like permease
LQMTAAVAAVASLTFLPAYVVLGEPRHLVELSASMVLAQFVVHGVLAGVLAVLAFSRSVQLLGPSRAALYPALVPALSLLIGIPLTGDRFTVSHALGLGLSTLGLLLASNAMNARRFSLRHHPLHSSPS